MKHLTAAITAVACMLWAAGCASSEDADSGGATGSDAGIEPGTCTVQPEATTGEELSCDVGSSEVCTRCAGEDCCELWQRCGNDTRCGCVAICVGAAGLVELSGCLDSCGVMGSPPGFRVLADCMALNCPDSDECSAPPAFSPPPDIEARASSSTDTIGSGVLADCSFDPDLAFDPLGEVLQLQSADGGVCLRLERRNEGAGSDENTRWTLLDVRVGPLGAVVHVGDPTAVCWNSSHHNFFDTAHVYSGTRHYDVEVHQMDHTGPTTYLLHTFEQGPLESGFCSPTTDGLCPVGDPIELLPVGP